MAGLRIIRNTNAFKFILQVFILSQKHIMGVNKVVWCGLDVVWGGLVVVWGGLGCFGVVWGVSTDRFKMQPPARYSNHRCVYVNQCDYLLLTMSACMVLYQQNNSYYQQN